MLPQIYYNYIILNKVHECSMDKRYGIISCVKLLKSYYNAVAKLTKRAFIIFTTLYDNIFLLRIHFKFNAQKHD